MKKPLLFFILLSICISFDAKSEGTAQLDPSPTDLTMLLINDPTYGSFATFGAGQFESLYFTVKDPSETVYFGLSDGRNSTSTGQGDNYSYRIVDPNGVVVKGPIFVSTANESTSSYAEAVAGPAALGIAGGYVTTADFEFNPAIAGDYSIEFQSATNANNRVYLRWWDITVANAAGTAEEGRVWAYNWGLRTPQVVGASGGFDDAWDRPFNGKFFVFSDNDQDGVLEGLTNSIDFNESGFRGLSFAIAFNSFGVVDTGNIVTDRQSQEDVNSTTPEFPIFLNNPDDCIWMDGPVGQLTTDATVLICVDDETSNIMFESTVPGQVQVILDFNGTGEFEPNTTDVVLAGTISDTAPFTTSIPWDNTDGLGNPIFFPQSIPVIATLLQGVFHFPVYDTERNPSGFDVASVRPGANFTGDLFYDDTFIVTDNSINGSGTGEPLVELNGCPAPCHGWLSFDPTDGNALGYGNLNTINTWWIANTSAQSTILTQICILPVKLISFTAEYSDGETTLEWATASEVNSSHFEVEKRVGELGEFEKIGQVSSQGNSNTRFDYSFSDFPDENESNIFYRLKQVDLDGQFEYTDVVFIQTESNNEGLELAQTVVTGQNLNFNFEIEEDERTAFYFITSTNGNVIAMENFNNLSPGNHFRSAILPIHSMTRGVYFLTVQTDKRKITKKFVY